MDILFVERSRSHMKAVQVYKEGGDPHGVDALIEDEPMTDDLNAVIAHTRTSESVPIVEADDEKIRLTFLNAAEVVIRQMDIYPNRPEEMADVRSTVEEGLGVEIAESSSDDNS